MAQRCATLEELERNAARVQLALALDVARTTVNEAGLRATLADVDLVYEATRGNADTDRARLAWLRHHSACTNRGDCNRDGRVDELDDDAASARPGNAGWTRDLSWSDERPARLRRAFWRADHWRRVRRLALVRVLADEPTRVCGGARVLTWGRPRAFALRPQLEPLDCGARNLGGALRSSSKKNASR